MAIWQSDGVQIEYRPDTHDNLIIHEIWQKREYWLPGYDIKAGETVIDIGAHIGVFALWAASKGAHVFAFEPEPENYRMLEANVALNPALRLGVQPFRNAVGKHFGTVRLNRWQKTKGNTGSYSTIYGAGASFVDVSQITLHEALTISGGECDFLKIDTEGSEYDILYGLPMWDWPKIRRIVLEWHGSRDESIKLAEYLKTLGYRIDGQPQYSVEILPEGLVYAIGHMFARREA